MKAARDPVLIVVAAAVMLVLVSYRDGTYIWGVRQSEGGLWLDEAVRILGGEHPYRDFFDFVAPGNLYLIAFALAVFGKNTSAVGFLVILTGIGGALLAYAVAARVLPRAWAFCAAALFLVYAYIPYSPLNHKWPTLLLVLGALVCVLSRRSRGRVAVAGVLLGAATFCTQDMGLGAALGLALALLMLGPREGRSALGVFAAAYLAACALAFGSLILDAGWSNVWYDLFLFPARQYHESNRFSVDLGESYAAARTLTVYGLALLAIAFALRGMLARSWRTEPPAIVLLTLVGLGLVAGSMTRQLEPVSFGLRALPAMIAAMYVLHSWLARSGRAALGVAFFVVTLVPTALLQVVDARWTRALALGEHRAGRVWHTTPFEDLVWLERTAAPGEAIFFAPGKGGYLFLSGTRNATSFPVLLDWNFTPAAQLDQAAREIASACAAAGLWDHGRTLDPIERSSLRPLYEAVRRDYESVGRARGDVELFRRRNACPR
jgi:hypothetical protein